MGATMQQLNNTVESNDLSLKILQNYQKDAKKALNSIVFNIAVVGILGYFFPTRATDSLTYKSFILVIYSWAIGYHAYYGYLNCLTAYTGFRLAYLGVKMRFLEYQSQRDTFLISQKINLRRALFDDISAYDNELRDSVKLRQQKIAEEMKRERWTEQGLKLGRELETDLAKFSLEPDERAGIMEHFDSLSNPKKKREFISRIGPKLAIRQYLARTASDPPITPAEPSEKPINKDEQETDFRLILLHRQAAKSMIEESRRLVREAAVNQSRHEQIRLLKQAIRLEEKSRQPIIEIPSAKPETAKEKNHQISYVSLQSMVREKFSLETLLPPRINSVMAREIILALLAPGRSGGRFQSVAVLEDILKVMVRKQFEVYLKNQFDPRLFQDTLNWMAREEIIITKFKNEIHTYSLSSKSGGKSAEAQKVINAVLSFDRSL